MSSDRIKVSSGGSSSFCVTVVRRSVSPARSVARWHTQTDACVARIGEAREKLTDDFDVTMLDDCLGREADGVDEFARDPVGRMLAVLDKWRIHRRMTPAQIEELMTETGGSGR